MSGLTHVDCSVADRHHGMSLLCGRHEVEEPPQRHTQSKKRLKVDGTEGYTTTLRGPDLSVCRRNSRERQRHKERTLARAKMRNSASHIATGSASARQNVPRIITTTKARGLGPTHRRTRSKTMAQTMAVMPRRGLARPTTHSSKSIGRKSWHKHRPHPRKVPNSKWQPRCGKTVQSARRFWKASGQRQTN